MKSVWGCCLVAASLLAAPALAIAQRYPDKPVTIVVPYGAGGQADLVARKLAEGLSKRLSGTFVVDNKVGAGGKIGRAHLERSPADGYTLLVDRAGAVTEDMLHITFLAGSTPVLVVPANSPWQSAQDLVKSLRTSPRKHTFGTIGIGGESDRLLQNFLQATGAQATAVSFKGSSPALLELQAGSIEAMFIDQGSVGNLVASGKLRALAVTTGRAGVGPLSGVKPLADQGVPGLRAATWYALYAPKGTPTQLLQQIETESYRALSDVRQSLVSSGLDLGPADEGVNSPPTCDSGYKYCICKKKCILEKDDCPTKC